MKGSFSLILRTWMWFFQFLKGGTVTAMTINMGLLLGFVPSHDAQVREKFLLSLWFISAQSASLFLLIKAKYSMWFREFLVSTNMSFLQFLLPHIFLHLIHWLVVYCNYFKRMFNSIELQCYCLRWSWCSEFTYRYQ